MPTSKICSEGTKVHVFLYVNSNIFCFNIFDVRLLIICNIIRWKYKSNRIY